MVAASIGSRRCDRPWNARSTSTALRDPTPLTSEDLQNHRNLVACIGLLNGPLVINSLTLQHKTHVAGCPHIKCRGLPTNVVLGEWRAKHNNLIRPCQFIVKPPPYMCWVQGPSDLFNACRLYTLFMGGGVVVFMWAVYFLFP